MNPKISIVTICRNARADIAATMASVLKQSYVPFEYLIIDGGSTDGTVEYIKNHGDDTVKWISERDDGIYDAMNKGAQLASGEWVLFMNAGDRFYSADSLRQLLATPVTELDVVYGDHEVRYPGEFSRIQRAGDIAALWKGMVCSHQALVCRTQLLRERPFGTGSLAEDFGFLMHLQASHRRFEHRPVIVASISAGGVSDTRRGVFLRDRLRIVMTYKRGVGVRAYYAGQLALNFLKQVLRECMPRPLWRWLLARKYGLSDVSR
jgi:glycosyltransferase involved in cell wall biosynthesis